MKNILLLTTGGTIACVETSEGLAPSLSGERLLKKIPEVKSKSMIVHFRLNNFTVGYQNRYLCYF